MDLDKENYDELFHKWFDNLPQDEKDVLCTYDIFKAGIDSLLELVQPLVDILNKSLEEVYAKHKTPSVHS